GHTITGALAFIVGEPTPAGMPKSISTTPKITTVLNGSRSGPLNVVFSTSATSGEVEWSNPAFDGPFTWPISGNGKQAKASGILPTTGKWTMRATLIGKAGSVIVTNGAVSLG
ncbi:MAG: hypothetical protein Q8L05_11625, partial [Actinomycetota bacterium]|nr:hypothetical protein [Actinomycetota bacterium]